MVKPDCEALWNWATAVVGWEGNAMASIVGLNPEMAALEHAPMRHGEGQTVASGRDIAA